jgi:hypothetical protein
MNREWPGNENGATAASRHAGLLFNRLLRPNADFAIDFHTRTTGFDVTAFNLASMDMPEIKAMVELYPVGQIFANHAYPGVLHNAFVDVGIPAFTPEIGAARVLNLEMISLFVEGTMNVLKHHGILAGPLGRTGKDVGVFIGNSALPILATQGGLVERLRNIHAAWPEVTGQRSDAMSEPGNPPGIHPFPQGDAGRRRESSRVIRHLVPVSDCGDNFVRVGDPLEGSAVSVVVVEETVDGSLKVDDGSEDAALQSAACSTWRRSPRRRGHAR